VELVRIFSSFDLYETINCWLFQNPQRQLDTWVDVKRKSLVAALSREGGWSLPGAYDIIAQVTYNLG